MRRFIVSFICGALCICLAGCAAMFGASTSPSNASMSNVSATNALDASESSAATQSSASSPTDADEVSGMIDELTLMPTGDMQADDNAVQSDDLTVENDDSKGTKFTVTYKDNEETVQIGDIDKNDSGMLTIRIFSNAFTGEITDDPADMFPVLACVVVEGTRYDPMPQTGGVGFMDYCFDTKIEPDEILVGLYEAFSTSDYNAFVSVNPRTKLPV